ncbi:hypothetical protein HanHA300_Chr02g0061511 [Helianthus annuus]|nr:hypothetical protein HanHA300_Chr02g0061511 [Helianthus annuus]KAJ0619317.1 hypothetical protein HanHA89_Chr02g0070011 [Helianthus annuus]
MGARKDLSVSYSRLTQEEVEAFCIEWGIGLKHNPVAPGCDKSIDQCPPGSIALYCRHFEFSNLCHPFSIFVLNAIRECPSRVRPFPEHLLVLLGNSKLWDKPDWDPVLMRNGQVMSALDFVKSDDTSDVAFTDVEAMAGDDAVVRGSEHRFEDIGYVNVSNVKGFTKTAAPKTSTRRFIRRMLKGLGGDVEKEKNLVVIRKKKSGGKKAVVTSVQGSPRKDIEGLSEDEIYVPNWGVKVRDSFKDANVCANVLANFAPPSVRGSILEMEGDTMLSRLILSSCNLSALLAEGVTRFRKGMQEYDEFSKKKDKMKASMAAMKKDIDGFAKKGRILGEKSW